MQINQLKYLMCVANCGSMSTASEKLFVSQPTVSSAIINLEKEFNITIFNRNNNGVTLTEEGKLFISKAKYILDELDSLDTLFNSKNADINDLVLNISCDINYDLGNTISKIYCNSDYEKINLTVNESVSSKVFNDVLSGKSEIGFFMTNSVDINSWLILFEKHNIEYEELNKNSGYVLVGKNSHLYNKEFITEDDLTNLTIIHYIDNISMCFEDVYPKRMIPLYGKNKSIFLSDKRTIEQIVSNTDSFLICGNNNFENLPHIKSIPLQISDFYFSFYLIKKKDTQLSYHANLFIDIFKYKCNNCRLLSYI